jgi:hypothetical protein
MSIPREIEIELDEFPLLIGGVKVGSFTGSAFVQMDNGSPLVTALWLDGRKTETVMTEIGAMEKTRDITMVLKPSESGIAKPFIFHNIASQIEADPDTAERFIEETTE